MKQETPNPMMAFIVIALLTFVVGITLTSQEPVEERELLSPPEEITNYRFTARRSGLLSFYNSAEFTYDSTSEEWYVDVTGTLSADSIRVADANDAAFMYVNPSIITEAARLDGINAPLTSDQITEIEAFPGTFYMSDNSPVAVVQPETSPVTTDSAPIAQTHQPGSTSEGITVSTTQVTRLTYDYNANPSSSASNFVESQMSDVISNPDSYTVSVGNTEATLVDGVYYDSSDVTNGEVNPGATRIVMTQDTTIIITPKSTGGAPDTSSAPPSTTPTTTTLSGTDVTSSFSGGNDLNLAGTILYDTDDDGTPDRAVDSAGLVYNVNSQGVAYGEPTGETITAGNVATPSAAPATPTAATSPAPATPANTNPYLAFLTQQTPATEEATTTQQGQIDATIEYLSDIDNVEARQTARTTIINGITSAGTTSNLYNPGFLSQLYQDAGDDAYLQRDWSSAITYYGDSIGGVSTTPLTIPTSGTMDPNTFDNLRNAITKSTTLTSTQKTQQLSDLNRLETQSETNMLSSTSLTPAERLAAYEDYLDTGRTVLGANRDLDGDGVPDVRNLDSSDIDSLQSALTANGITLEQQAALDALRNQNYMNSESGLSGGMRSIYNTLNIGVDWTSGYQGASFFYTDSGFLYDQIDNEWARAWLNGLSGVASQLCQQDILDDITTDDGFAFSSTTGGAYAHIEGEKITVTNYTATGTPQTSYIYLVSFAVSPGSSSSGCDLEFRTYLDRTTPLIVSNNSNTAYHFEVEWGGTAIAYTGSNMVLQQSSNSYTQACILFDSITQRGSGTCLLGVSEGDYLCNTITAAQETTYNTSSFDTGVSAWWSDLGYWGDSSGSTSSGTSTQNTGTAAVNSGI